VGSSLHHRPAIRSAMAVTSVAALDLTLITAALPVIVGDLGGHADATSVISAHLVASAVAVAAVGPVSDVVGRRRLTVASLAVLGLALVATALAPTLATLLLARAAAGLGSGALLTLAQASVADGIPSRDRGRAQGSVVAVVGIATAAGPALGGLLVGLVGWRGAFLLQLPLILVAALTFRRMSASRTRAGGDRQLDVRSVLLLVAALIGLVGGLQLTVTGRLHAALAVTWLGLGAAAGVAFVRVQRHHADPLVRLQTLSDRSVRVAVAVGGLTNGSLYLLVVLLPLQLQGPIGLDPARAGIAQLPLLTAFVVASATVGRRLSATGRTGRLVMHGGIGLTVGFAITTAAALLTDVEVPVALATAVLLAGAAVAGAGAGTMYPTLLIGAQNVASAGDLGAVTGLLALGRQLGALLALAGAGIALATSMSSAYVLASSLGLGLAMVATVAARHLPDRPLLTVLSGDASRDGDGGYRTVGVIDLATVGTIGSLLPAGRLVLARADLIDGSRRDAVTFDGSDVYWIDATEVEFGAPPDTADPLVAGRWLARALERSGDQVRQLLVDAGHDVRPIGLTGGPTGGRAALLATLLLSLHEQAHGPVTEAWPVLVGDRDDVWGRPQTVATMLSVLVHRHGSTGAALEALGIAELDRQALISRLFARA
jgi:MFS family permease